jgi:phosphoribosylformimino-5-aminoimidazole carboxamide ribotide isomerase
VDVIGVLDLRRGLAVHAVAGERERYRPASMVARPEIGAGDAVALANAYITIFGLSQLYVADLDAIVDRNPQSPLVRAIARVEAALWLDRGVRTTDEARVAISDGAHRVVVGLETLPSFDTLRSIVDEIGSDRTVFSLDLRNGSPLASSPHLRRQSPEDVVRQAAGAGASIVIVLDLARVGTSSGPVLDLIQRMRAATREVRLIAGGGVRGIEDVIRLEQAGCDGVLVATALLTGKLSVDDVRILRAGT